MSTSKKENDMDGSERRPTAKIYQFPTRRPDGRVRSDKTVAGESRSPVSIADFGGWYHQAAIQDAARDRRS
jgi:hypothetical protein